MTQQQKTGFDEDAFFRGQSATDREGREWQCIARIPSSNFQYLYLYRACTTDYLMVEVFSSEGIGQRHGTELVGMSEKRGLE